MKKIISAEDFYKTEVFFITEMPKFRFFTKKDPILLKKGVENIERRK
jgi:hypothetical protein